MNWVIRRVFSEKLKLKLYLSEKATASGIKWGGMGEHPREWLESDSDLGMFEEQKTCVAGPSTSY